MSSSAVLALSESETAPSSIKASRTKKKANKDEGKAWSLSGSATAGKNLDYYSDYFSAFGFGGSYTFSKQYVVSIGSSYSQSLQEYVNPQDEDRYGFGDIGLDFSTPGIWKSPDGLTSFSPSISGVIPTSRASQKASLQGSISPGFSIGHSFTNWLTLTTNHSIDFNSYGYETGDEAGNYYNSPFGITNGIGLSSSYEFITLSVGYAYYYSIDAAGTNVSVQSLKGGMSLAVQKNISLSVGAKWQDRLLTNNALFDDDTTSFNFGLGFTL